VNSCVFDFADFRCLPGQDLAGFRWCSCYSRRERLLVVGTWFQFPLHSHVYAISQQNYGYCCKHTTSFNGEVNEQRCSVLYTQGFATTLSATCQDSLGAAVQSIASGSRLPPQRSAETEDPTDVLGEPLAAGRWASRPQMSVTGDQNLLRATIYSTADTI
jgi:hypothetical protein